MPSVRLPRPLCLLAGLALVLVACGPRPAEPPPVQRGTALPPPGVTLAPAR